MHNPDELNEQELNIYLALEKVFNLSQQTARGSGHAKFSHSSVQKSLDGEIIINIPQDNKPAVTKAIALSDSFNELQHIINSTKYNINTLKAFVQSKLPSGYVFIPLNESDFICCDSKLSTVVFANIDNRCCYNKDIPLINIIIKEAKKQALKSSNIEFKKDDDIPKYHYFNNLTGEDAIYIRDTLRNLHGNYGKKFKIIDVFGSPNKKSIVLQDEEIICQFKWNLRSQKVSGDVFLNTDKIKENKIHFTPEIDQKLGLPPKELNTIKKFINGIHTHYLTHIVPKFKHKHNKNILGDTHDNRLG